MSNRKGTAEVERTEVAPIAIVPNPERGSTSLPQWSLEGGHGENDDSLVSFKSESLEPESPRVQPAGPRMPLSAVAFVVAAVFLAVPFSWLGWQTWKARTTALSPPAPVVQTGTAVINSVPDGASIAIDGIARGTTPLRVSLAAGAHSIQITSGSTSRTLPIHLEAGSVVSQYIELALAPPALGGRLEIGSDPSGADVRVDGVPKGVTPLVIEDIAPGQHRVTVSAGGRVVNRTVNVTQGNTATIVVSRATVDTAASGGWISVDTPIEMEILEGGRVLGTTRTDQLMLPVGSHRIEFANAGLEFSTARTVQIVAGKTASVAISPPSGRLSVNAVPWADVSIDGLPRGTTPLGELSVPIGTHEVVFRHPQLGERRQTVTVKAQTPARIGIDLRK
jgi:PEGA domain